MVLNYVELMELDTQEAGSLRDFFLCCDWVLKCEKFI